MRSLFVLLPLFGITNASPAANSGTPSSMVYAGATNDDYMDPVKHREWWTQQAVEVEAYIQGKSWNFTRQEQLWDCVRKNDANKREWVPANGPAKYANWDVDWKFACSQWL